MIYILRTQARLSHQPLVAAAASGGECEVCHPALHPHRPSALWAGAWLHEPACVWPSEPGVVPVRSTCSFYAPWACLYGLLSQMWYLFTLCSHLLLSWPGVLFVWCCNAPQERTTQVSWLDLVLISCLMLKSTRSKMCYLILFVLRTCIQLFNACLNGTFMCTRLAKNVWNVNTKGAALIRAYLTTQ